jgi:hypothetical protein
MALKIAQGILIAAALTACSEETVVYECMNTRSEWGNIISGINYDQGRGRTFIEIDKNASFTLVNYDSRFLISGKLEMDSDVYIKDASKSPSIYPKTINRLQINRYSGGGYFQSSRYKDGDSLPEYITESLESCHIVEKRL